MEFTRPFTALVFNTKGYNEYEEIFGKLRKIKVTTNGYNADGKGVVADANGDGKADESGDILPSTLAYITGAQGARYLVDCENPDNSKLIAATSEEAATDGVNTVTLNMNNGDGLKWSDDNKAFMAIHNVDRSAFEKAGVKESVTVLYDFENINFEVTTLKTDANWPATPGNFINVPELDITSYPYFYVHKGGPDDRAILIINSGNFNQVFTENGDKIAWRGSERGLASVGKIISKVQLTKEEKARLGDFVNLESITLLENSELEEGTFANNKKLTEIHFPKVQKIESGVFGAKGTEAKLKIVDLPAYDFTDDVVADEILNPATLEELNMSGATGLNLGFPSTGFNLQGYTALKKITVSDGFELGPNSFAGCTALEEVEGAVALDKINSYNAFLNCGNLEEINITGTIIPASAFENCTALGKVWVNGNQVAPTLIAESAFAGCSALAEMDLSKVEDKLGDNAFQGCTSFYGGKEGTKLVVRLGATEIGANAFDGCSVLEHIDFMKATKIGSDMLKNTPALKQVQFGQPINISTGTYAATTFGDAAHVATVQLFINSKQDSKTFNKNVLYLGSSSTKVTITFNSIRAEQGI